MLSVYIRSLPDESVKQIKNRHKAALYLAERAGFEPAVGCYPTHAFQACDLNRSSTSPKGRAG